MALTSFESVPTKNYGQPRMRSHANAFGFVWRQTFERPLEHVLADTNEGSPGRGSDKPEHEASPTERLYVCLRHRATTIFMLLADPEHALGDDPVVLKIFPCGATARKLRRLLFPRGLRPAETHFAPPTVAARRRSAASRRWQLRFLSCRPQRRSAKPCGPYPGAPKAGGRLTDARACRACGSPASPRRSTGSAPPCARRSR